MIHPTRTNLLRLRDKVRSLLSSVGILKARRQALIREFLASSREFLANREEISRTYGRSLEQLHITEGLEGRSALDSLVAISEPSISVDLKQENVLGLRYWDLTLQGDLPRTLLERGYDPQAHTPHLTEATHLFEQVAAAVLRNAALECRVKKLSAEIRRVTRTMRVLEERLLPRQRRQIKVISLYLGERDRETTFRLRKFKELRQGAQRAP